MLLILDGDHYTYRAAASCSPTKNKPYQEDLSDALFRVENMLAQTFLDLNSQRYEFYISGEGNWRKQLYPEYKSNRKNKPLPLHLEEIREHVILKYGAEIINGKEVDDQCGIRLTQERDAGNSAVCVSLDKDLQQVPGEHYNFNKKERVNISPLQGLRKFYSQVITGDSADHIPAFDGAFRTSLPKFVAKLLEPLEEMTDELEMYSYCCDVYSDQVSWADDWETILQRNASVLWVQRKEGDKWRIPGQKND